MIFYLIIPQMLKSHWNLKWCPGGGTCVGGKRQRKWKSGWDRAGDMRRAAGVTCKRQEKEIGRESENDALQKEDAFITSPIMCPDHFPSPKAQSHYLSPNTTNISLSLSLLIPKPAKPIRAKGEGASRISLPNSLWRKKGSTSTKDRQLVFGRRNRSLRLNCLTIKIGQ